MRRSPADGYFLGLPAWAYPGWRDRYFPDEPDRLANYAAVFNTVEGNTTFYGIPDESTISPLGRFGGGHCAPFLLPSCRAR